MLVSPKTCVFVVCFFISMRRSDSTPPRGQRNKTFEDSLIEQIASEAIIFADSVEESVELLNYVPVASHPKCAGESTFCEEIDTYPYNYLRYTLDRQKINKDLFVVDESPVENRVSEPGEHFLCDSIDRVIFPKIGKTKYKKWKYIINQGENGQYAQGVRVEICRRPSRPCRLIGEFPTGYVTSCKQKYTYRRLLSISDNGDHFQDVFEMPSACCCSYRADPSILINFGKKVTPSG